MEVQQMQKPKWWPKNPYPVAVFPMPEEQYSEIVPDSDTRTALSGMLGRRFWNIASEAIWAAMSEAIKEGWLTPAAPDRLPCAQYSDLCEHGIWIRDCWICRNGGR